MRYVIIGALCFLLGVAPIGYFTMWVVGLACGFVLGVVAENWPFRMGDVDDGNERWG